MPEQKYFIIKFSNNTFNTFMKNIYNNEYKYNDTILTEPLIKTG